MAIKAAQASKNFDVRFGPGPDGENATTLTVVLKLAIDWLEPDPNSATTVVKDKNGVEFKLKSWPPAARDEYKKNLKDTVEGAWNDRLFLLLPDPADATVKLPDPDYNAFVSRDPAVRAKNPPFVRCALEIQFVEQVHTYHALIHLARLDAPAQRFRQFTKVRPANPNEGVFSDTGLDLVSKGTDSRGDQLYQFPVAHEVGHLLGLDHPNVKDPGCRTGAEDICYGGDWRQQREMMGLGYVVDASAAGPWLTGVGLLTGSSRGWRAIHWDPTLLGFDVP
jgi:hypothetical protein